MERIRNAGSEEVVFRIDGRFDQTVANRLRQCLLADETRFVSCSISESKWRAMVR